MMLVLIYSLLIICFTAISSTSDGLELQSYKHLVKRERGPQRQCSSEYGYPDYDDCRSAIVQLPTWVSWTPRIDVNGEGIVSHVFRENPPSDWNPRVAADRRVIMPMRRSFGQFPDLSTSHGPWQTLKNLSL